MANHQTTNDIFLKKIDFRLTQDDVKLLWEGLCRHYIMNSRWHTINAASHVINIGLWEFYLKHSSWILSNC